MIFKTANFVSNNLTKLMAATAGALIVPAVFDIPSEVAHFLQQAGYVGISVSLLSGLFLLGVGVYRIHKLSENPEFDRVV